VACDETIRDYLERDHEELRALLARADRGPILDVIAFEEFRSRLLRHIGIEEKVLLPAVREVLGGSLSRAREIRVQHGAIASLLVPTPDLALVSELRALLATHDMLEEGEAGIYAECARSLGVDRCVALAHAAASFPEVPAARHFDGEHVVRTADAAMRVAQRIKLGREN
jgi:hypothetical protein